MSRRIECTGAPTDVRVLKDIYYCCKMRQITADLSLSNLDEDLVKLQMVQAVARIPTDVIDFDCLTLACYVQLDPELCRDPRDSASIGVQVLFWTF